MKTFITSDIHFSHNNIIKFCNRPYADKEEMDEAIIQIWNETVSTDDHVYILGDVSFANKQRTIDILYRLNGFLHLIKGNHDEVMNHSEIKERFITYRDYYEMKYNGNHIVMFHFPISSWHKRHYGAFHLHGHLHGNPSGLSGRIKDVGMDTNNMKPYLLDDIIEELSVVEDFKSHH